MICILLKSTDLGLYFSAGSMGLSSLTSTQRAPEDSYVGQGGALWSFSRSFIVTEIVTN